MPPVHRDSWLHEAAAAGTRGGWRLWPAVGAGTFRELQYVTSNEKINKSKQAPVQQQQQQQQQNNPTAAYFFFALQGTTLSMT